MSDSARWFVGWIGMILGVGSAIAASEPSIAPEKELLIIDPSVVDSPLATYPGPLSIGHLFDEIAPDGDGAGIMRHWLETWTVEQPINGEIVAPRRAMLEKIIRPWQERDGWSDEGDEAWRPNFANAPFRLLAVVNRIDLAQLPGSSSRQYYGAGSGFVSPPQGRLVFAALDPDGAPLGEHFTVIFEYDMGVRPAEMADLARSWRCLHELEFGDAYRFALAKLTRRFTDHRIGLKEGERLTPKLLQVRTNDMALGARCEMREFRLKSLPSADVKSSASVVLKPAPLVGTPSMCFNERGREQRAMVALLRRNAKELEEGTFVLPATVEVRHDQKTSVLAGAVTIPDKRFHWFGKGLTNAEARHAFSRTTCNGCHAGDTGTEFCHIGPREAGKASELSDFLRIDARPSTADDPARRRRNVTSTEMADRIAAYLRFLQPGLKDHEVDRSIRRARRSH